MTGINATEQLYSVADFESWQDAPGNTLVSLLDQATEENPGLKSAGGMFAVHVAVPCTATEVLHRNWSCAVGTVVVGVKVVEVMIIVSVVRVVKVVFTVSTVGTVNVVL